MNWDAIGAIAELLGAIGVIASLVYLAGQIRHSREQMSQTSKQLEASTTAATFQVRAVPNTMMIQDPEVARIYWDGLADRSSLTEEDLHRFDPLMMMQFEAFSQQYFFHRQALSSADAWEMAEVGFKWSLEQRGYRQWWKTWKRVFPTDFGRYVDALVEEVLDGDPDRVE
jgi:hypothetical protein